ncbi:MAG: hypothetical protein ABJE47_05765 [bacterium]
MHQNLKTGAAAGTLFALLVLTSPASAQAPQAGPTMKAAQAAQAPTTTPHSQTPMECSAAVRGDSIPVRTTPVAVDAALTQAIGDSVKAEFPADSKIVVAKVAADPSAPKMVKLTLDTSAAAAGEWTLLVKGTTGACAGKVRVTPASK